MAAAEAQAWELAGGWPAESNWGPNRPHCLGGRFWSQLAGSTSSARLAKSERPASATKRPKCPIRLMATFVDHSERRALAGRASDLLTASCWPAGWRPIGAPQWPLAWRLSLALASTERQVLRLVIFELAASFPDWKGRKRAWQAFCLFVSSLVLLRSGENRKQTAGGGKQSASQLSLKENRQDAATVLAFGHTMLRVWPRSSIAGRHF